MNTLTLITAGVAALAAASTATAQDYTADPLYGLANLSSGFSPDPHRVDLTAGGSRQASNVRSDCRGWVANAPDYSVRYNAGSLFELYFSVDSDVDTTLLINTPTGEWICDDDGADEPLNPLIHFENPQSGRYDIWVGTYRENGQDSATLFVSEIGEHTRDGGLGGSSGGGGYSSGGPDYTLDARYGELNLSSGFSNDPRTVSVRSGGSHSASDTVRSDCRGYIATAPDYRVNYSAGSTLPLIFSVDSSADTTLVINGPNGQWYCDDDGGAGTNPSYTFNNPQSGQYDIWVGTYSNSYEDARLYISELTSQ